jgi:cytochrome c553
MSPKFSFKSGLLTFSLSAAAVFAVLTPALDAQAGKSDEPVDCSSLKVEPFKAFCKSVDSQRKKVGKKMQDAQTKFRTTDEKYAKTKCKDCHESGNNGGKLIGEWKALWEGGFKDALEKQFLP